MKALIIDTETSGLIANRTVRKALWPEIIEFAGTTMDWDSGEIHEEWSTLIKPSKKIEAKITEITGMTNADLKDAPHFANVATDIAERVAASDIVVAHNASYDVEMIELEFLRLGDKIKWPHIICTVEQTISLKGYRMKLGELHEYLFGMAHEDAHRAATDVKALVRIVKELRRREIL